MDHYEMVEKLRQKANVTYEEARAALEDCNWDILDALVQLESAGKVMDDSGATEYTTQEQPKQKNRDDDKESDFRSGLRRIGRMLVRLFQKGNANNFVLKWRRFELSMPVTVLVLLIFFTWPYSLVVLALGLVFGCRYSFQGPDASKKVNDAMDKAADAMHDDEP